MKIEKYKTQTYLGNSKLYGLRGHVFNFVQESKIICIKILFVNWLQYAENGNLPTLVAIG